MLGIPQLQHRLDDLTTRVETYEIGGESLDQLATRKATEVVEVRLNEVQESLMRASTHHTEMVVNEMRTHLESQISKVQRNIDLMRVTSSSASLPTSTMAIPEIPHQVVIDEAMYVALEDHFRGDPAVIRERQMQYIPYVINIATDQYPLLDLGCGRGEWLSVLREVGVPSHGVDSNRACIDDCLSLDLKVELADLVSHLKSLPESSVGAITMFQVLEHLPFPVLVDVLRSAVRVLKPGGVFIGEVPNSETLRVAASNFWIDPTHERPLFPGLLTFLAEQVGFNKIEGLYSTPLEKTPDLSSLDPTSREAFLQIFNQINGPGDFALIATA